MKCKVTEDVPKLIRKEFAKIILRNRGKSTIEMKTLFGNYLKQLGNEYDLSNGKLLAAIEQAAKLSGDLTTKKEFFNLEEIKQIIYDTKNRSIEELAGLSETKSTELDNPDQVLDRKLSDKDFARKAYGNAVDLKERVIKVGGINLVNALVIDRKNGYKVYNDADRNRNIRNYQQELLNSVVNHLHEYFTQSGTYPKAFEQIYKDHTMYNPTSGAYTGIVERVYNYAEQSIGSKTIGNADTLRQMSESNDPYYKNKFRAYNDWVLLTHFDSFIQSKYGKSIMIKNFGDGRFSGEDKYFFSEKSAYNVTSWRNKEDHDIKGTTNSITVELIETTQKYDYGSVDNAIEGNTVSFSQYTNVISKLKDAVWESGDLEYDMIKSYDENLKLEGKPGILDQLSDPTRRIFEQAGSLKTLINLIRLDAQTVTQAIFELLSNTNIKNLLEKQTSNPVKNLTKDEWDVIWSLYKGIFEVDGEHSVNGLDSEMYSYVTQNVDSIFPNRFLQYYYDQDGVLQVRNMRDGQDSRLKREIEQTVVTINAKMTIPDYKTVMDKYQITPITDANGDFSGIIIKKGIKGQNIRVLKNGNVKGILNKDVIAFASEVLGLPPTDDALYQILQGEYRNSSSMYQGLLNFAGRTLMLQYISNVLIKDAKTKSEIVTGLESLFGVDWQQYVRINTDLKEVNLVHKNDIPAIENIARANAIKKGVYSSTQVKSGAGTTQSGSTFSRLLGSMQSQWVLQNKRRDSATRETLLITNPEIIKGVYTAKEIQHQTGVKDHTKFNTAEFASATIIHDFIGGLLTRNGRNDIIGNGVIGIIPSVNSDKGTIGRLAVDLNTVIEFIDRNGNSVIKAIKDLNRTELIDFINFELGDIYTKSYLNIQEDWNKIYKYMATKYPETFGSLVNFPRDYLFNFEAFKRAFSNYGLESQGDFIRRMVIEYNNTHPFEKVSLIDQVHYSGNSNIENNKTLIGYLKRFNPRFPDLDGVDLSEYADAETFWKIKELQVLKSLIDANFKIDTTSEQPEMEYLRNNLLKGKNWIDGSTKEMILGKLNGKPIRNLQDLETAFTELTGNTKFNNVYQNIGRLFTEFGLEFELNPILSQYNMLDYVFSQEFMITTVGSCMAHPAKGNFTNKEETSILEPMLEMEAFRYQAQHKRNVSYTASMQAFQLNTLNGIPSKYNIAIIDDIRDKQFNISGDVDGIKPYDGATYVNPFVVYLENYSLGGARAGITKKQFIHYYDERTGTGGIIKTAGFGLTNQLILNSKMIQGMMQSMTDREWRTEGGSVPDVDINHTFNGEKINFSDMFYREGSKYFRIVDIVKHGKNQYRIIKQQVNVIGQDVGSPIVEQELTTIDTNYKLWKALGGMHSMELHNGHLVPSENSIKKTVEVINGVGEVRPGATRKKTQSDVYQPLKHSDIHYMPTIGAVKQGAANINSTDAYEMFKALGEGKAPVNKAGLPISTDLGTMTINMYQAGIQLDKEHHADQAELSLMTQVISACSHRGYSADQAMQLYHSLNTLTKNGIKDVLDPLVEYLKDEHNVNTQYEDLKQNFIASVMNVVVGQLAQQHDDGNLISKIADDLMQRLRDGQVLTYADIKDRIPVDNQQIYNKFMSTIAVFLTDSGIKMKIPGILSILCPSYDQIKLYGEKKLEELEQDPRGFEIALQELQDAAPFVFDGTTISRNNLRIGRRYQILYEDGRHEIRYVQTPLQRSKLIKDIRMGGITSVQEWVKEGRDLAAFDLHFNGLYDSVRLSLWDLDSVNAAAEFKAMENASPEEQLKFILKYRNLIQKHLPEEIQGRFLRGVSSEKQINFWDKDISYLNAEFFDNIIANDLAALSPNGSEFIETHSVLVDGREVLVDLNSIETFPYEIVMSKTFLTEFGLDKYTSLNSVLSDPNYFTNKLLENYNTQINSNDFDVELKRINSNNVYLKSNRNHLAEDGFTKVLTEYHTERSKIIMRDAYGEDMFEVSSASDEVWQDQFGNTVIVTNNFNFYLQNFSYHLVKMSSTLNNQRFQEILNDLGTVKNRQAKRAYKWLTQDDGENMATHLENAIRNNSRLYNSELNQEDLDMFQEIGDELYAAFKESLNIIASRTPSQSMQSFMPMKVVAYENQDVNYAYVSTAQIWLQGSDFDIDAVSLATYRISNGGRLELWSPYAQVSYDANGNPTYKDALNLPFPTGVKSKIINLDGQTEELAEPYYEEALEFFNEVLPYVNTLFTVFDRPLGEKRVFRLQINSDHYSELHKLLKIFNKHNSTFYNPNAKLAEMLGEQDLQKLQLITKELSRINNEHNLYLDNLNQTKMEHIANNYSQKQMLDIISDPMNLPHGQSSVDAVVQPFKNKGDESPEGKAVKFRTPGNFMNKAESIVENQVGREAIGICATGLKTFFGLSAYYNNIINNSKDPKKLQRLILGREGITLTKQLKDGSYEPQTYYTLANVRPKLEVLKELEEILSSDNPELYQDLLEKKKNIIGKDAALQLSALLSLATDNAKELQLSKLNAGTSTIGMYIYGITIGMDFNDIAQILMSDVGKVITNVMKGNVFNQNYGYNSLNSAFNYLELGPNLNAYNELNFDENNKPIKQATEFFVEQWMGQQFFKKNYANNRKKQSIKNMVGCLAWLEGVNLGDKIEAVLKLKNLSDPKWDDRTKARYNQMIEAIVDYVKQVDIIKSNKSNEIIYNNLKTLAAGAQEARLQGQLFSLNQGLPTKSQEIINKVNNIQALIQQRLQSIQDELKRSIVVESFKQGNIKSYKDLQTYLFGKVPDIPNLSIEKEAKVIKEERNEEEDDLEDVVYAGAKFQNATFDLTEFCFNEEYREKVIDVYDQYKHTYNILDSISSVPHFFGYLQALAVLHESAKATSVRYATAVKFGKSYIEQMDIMQQDDREYAYKGISDYIADVSRRMWMLSNEITVPVTKQVVANGNIYNLSKNQIVPITLGTVDGDATFKLWFEQVVIPDLKKRFNKNEFVKNLKQQINTKNVSKNATINYTLGGINMMPRKDDDSARAILQNMKMSFNNLAGVQYEGLPLLDLFYFYGLIAYQGKPGENSLMSIFDEYHNEGIIKDFHNFEARFSQEFKANEDMISSKNESLYPFTLPVRSPYNSSSKCIYARNSETMDTELNVKVPSFTPGSKNGYVVARRAPDLQIRSLSPVSQNTIMGTDHVVLGSDGTHYKINLNDSYISYKGGIIEFSKDKRSALKQLIEDSEETQKEEILKNFIDEIINC